MKFYLLYFLTTFFVFQAKAQVLKGKVVDVISGEPLVGAVIGETSTGNGAATDFEGSFELILQLLPASIQVSYIGFETQTLVIATVDSPVLVKLLRNDQLMQDVNIVSDRILEKQKMNPLTVETLDVIAIKEAASGSFYESLSALKGVDMVSASLGFRIINTRGFNSTSPVRTLQLIDGVDNQSPGLNFSLGNFLGAADLDVKKVDIVQGASSAFFGPGAFNGVINMETKDPWAFQGLSAQMKMGERSLIESQFRFAESFSNKKGEDVFAFKISGFYMTAQDWRAENYDPIYGSSESATNPGRFDAVNIYGDEYFPAMDLSDAAPWTYRGIGTFYRTGYKESDVLDYDTKNLKTNAAMHVRLNPESGLESTELIVATNIGTGTTVYQGDNRFRLKDIFFMQNRIEIKKANNFFIRLYTTREDAGNSYDPYATSLRLLDEARSDEDWAKVYIRYWQDSINNRMNNLGYPGLVMNPNWNGNPATLWLPYNYAAHEQWLTQYNDSLVRWHSMVEQWTNKGNSGVIGLEELGYYSPESPQFKDAFNRITSLKNNEGEGGTRFFDRSSLYHAHAEKQLHVDGLHSLRFGANARLYAPNSDGTIFSDTSGTRIRNMEFGLYAGAEKKFMEDKLTASATIRLDKNQNFDFVYSPAASLVYTPKKNHYARLSFSSALRNPTLSDQYLFLNVGPATLSGNLQGVDSLVTLESWTDFRSSLNRDTLRYISAAPIRPEQVRTLEIGYRASFGDKLFADCGYYFSQYNHFIGYVIGLDVQFDQSSVGLPRSVDAFRFSANSTNRVSTQGVNIGLNYYLTNELSVSGNYSWNQLRKTNSDDPIIPAFNTPEHKYNLGFSLRELKFSKVYKTEWGLGANYKWIQGYLFEGSPQFTGMVPTYDVVDAQVNCLIIKAHTTIKLGCSNLMNKLNLQTYGGPLVGRMAYIQLTYEL